MGEDGESLYFALNEGYYREMTRRAEMVVAAGKATWGGPQGVSLAEARRNPAILEAAMVEAQAYRGLLRRKNANVWQTRLMIERTSLNAGHFEHPLLAAVAYDFAQTFLRPTLRNANGTSIGLNFTDTASDTRLVPVTVHQGLTPIFLERPGVPLEEGHFWDKDEVYYGEIKARATSLESQGIVPPSDPNCGDLLYVGIQRHRRKPQPGVPVGAEGGTFTWEGKLIHRRKWFYLGRFKTQLEAAVA